MHLILILQYGYKGLITLVISPEFFREEYLDGIAQPLRVHLVLSHRYIFVSLPGHSRIHFILYLL
jgi:hypothetical protein